MNARVFLLRLLLFALGTLALNEKGTIFLCTAINNSVTDIGNKGTQVNIAVKNVAQESLSSICTNLNKYFKDKKNNFESNQINCATNDDRTMMVGAHVPLDSGKEGQDAAKMVFKALQTVIQGDIDLQLFNDQDSDSCLVIDFDLDAVNAGLNNQDTTTIFPGATINLVLGGSGDPFRFSVDAVELSKSAAGLAIPDSQTLLQNIGPVTDSLASQSPVAGVTDISISGGLFIKIMYDLGGPFGFSTGMSKITADTWTGLIMQIAATIAQGGNQNACLGMSATALKLASDDRQSVSMVLTFCFS